MSFSIFISFLRLQADVVEHILREAPILAETLLDGLIWRSHKTQAARSRDVQKKHGSHHRDISFLRMACGQWFTTWSIWCKTWSHRCSPERWSALSSLSTLARSCTPFWHLSWTCSGRILFLGHQSILTPFLVVRRGCNFWFKGNALLFLRPLADRHQFHYLPTSYVPLCCPVEGFVFRPRKRLTKYSGHTKDSKQSIKPFRH